MKRAIVKLQSTIATRWKHASKRGQSNEISRLKVHELVQSEKVILCDLQHHHFGFAIQSLKNLHGNSDKLQDRNSARRRKEVLKKTGCLYKLDPFVEGDGLLRIGGRIRHATILTEVKHLLILPKSSQVTDLIVRHFHSKIGHHQGRGITHNAIHQAWYWIIEGRFLVARTTSKCVTCHRLRSRPLTQKMSDVPGERVSPTAPFNYTGMHVFGRKTWSAVAWPLRASHLAQSIWRCWIPWKLTLSQGLYFVSSTDEGRSVNYAQIKAPIL